MAENKRMSAVGRNTCGALGLACIALWLAPVLTAVVDCFAWFFTGSAASSVRWGEGAAAFAILWSVLAAWPLLLIAVLFLEEAANG